jgi:hypothetical protein
VVSWHPQNPQRQKSGFFKGPLSPPLTSDIIYSCSNSITSITPDGY